MSVPFVLDGNVREFNCPSYEPLTDKHLFFHLRKSKTLKQLRKSRLLNRKFEIANPEIKKGILQKNKLSFTEYQSKRLNIMKFERFRRVADPERNWILQSSSLTRPRQLDHKSFHEYIQEMRSRVLCRSTEPDLAKLY